MRLPNLNALRAFDAAARHLNFGRAAAELNVTQGAVAQQVRKLEAELGQKLFHRQARGLALTDAGRSLHPKVKQAMALLHEAVAPFAPISEQVVLSVPPSFATKWLVPRLPHFQALHPAITPKILAEEALTDLHRDGIGLAVRIGSEPQDPKLEIRQIAPMDLVAVASDIPERLRNKPQITLADMASEALVQDGHRHWERLLSEQGLTASGPLLQFNQTALAMDSASNGQGIALVPRLLVGTAPLQVLWEASRQPDQGFYLLWPRRASKAVQFMAQWLLKETAKP